MEKYMHKIKTFLQHFCEILELVAAFFVLCGLVISILSLLKNDSATFAALLKDISVFRHYLEEIFIIVIGIEFLEMLCRPNADNVIQVLIFLVARHMIVGETTPYEDFVSVISIAILCLLRKYLHGSFKKDKTEQTSLVKPFSKHKD